MSRSAYWEEVRRVVEQSRRRSHRFDPDAHHHEVCVEHGVRPVVSLYIEARRHDTVLSDVECSLLSSVLNDWLTLYAQAQGVHLDAEFTVHEVALAYVEGESLHRTVRSLTDVPACR